MKTQKKNSPPRQKGFSLIELMISMVVLLAVLGVVLGAVAQLQRRNSAENVKMDMVQSTREFLDQAVRDLHQTGFPPAASVSA